MKGYLALGLFVLTATACGGSEPTAPTPPAPAPSSGYAGRWSGTVLVLPLIGAGIPTIQSQPFSFTVSADHRVTDISIGYNLNGCSGAKTFSGLSIAIGASALNSQGQGWGYVSPTSTGRDRTDVYATFTSDRTASGYAGFVEFPGVWLRRRQLDGHETVRP